MERPAPAPRIPAALVIAGLWMRVALGAAFAALAAPLLVARDALRPGDGLALMLLGAALAWLGWRRARASLDGEAPVQREVSASPFGGVAARESRPA